MATSDFIVQNGLTVGGNVVPTQSNLHSLGSTVNWWNTIYGVSVRAQYADLAENYVADTTYEPGTVLDFGGQHEVTLSSVDGSKRVAGVVSTNPAYLMNSTQPGEFIASIALQGRVPTKVVGPVAKGDLMVSNGQGYARSEENPLAGAIIGKALEDFVGDIGVIEVVVGKH
jgi:hypothetical protein